MRIFITGATGAIGTYAVPALVAAEHTVSALARTPGKAATLHDQGRNRSRCPYSTMMVSAAHSTAMTRW